MTMTTMNALTDLDRDALRRALDWGREYQKQQPQIRLFTTAMPAEDTEAWFKLAEHMASLAQSHTLGLKPWQRPPIDIDDDDSWASPEEIALRQTMRKLGISMFEPDVPTAIANATHARATRKTPKRVKVGRRGAAIAR
jgi:hypothetical protein